jgi:photosystem II stability/assembly factor-like uncharacterized protein
MKTTFNSALLHILVAIFIGTLSGFAQGWHGIPTGSPVNLMAVHFPTPAIGYAAGDMGLLKTTNAGDSWTTVSVSSTSYFNSVFFTSDQTGFLAEGTGDIIKTTDGGISWTLSCHIPGADLRSITFPTPDIGYVAGFYSATDHGLTWKTVDGGQTWTDISPEGIQVQLLKDACFLNRDTGYICGGQGTIIKTINGGQSWSILNINYSNVLNAIHFPAPDTGYAVGWSSELMHGEVVKTVDGGETWVSVTPQNPPVFIRDTWFANVQTGYIVGENMRAMKTLDGGSTWIDQAISNADSSKPLYALHFSDVNNGFAVGIGGTIIKTTTGGLGISTRQFDDASVFITPNPTRDYLIINGLKGTSPSSFSIFNVSGSGVLKGNVSSTRPGISTISLTPGIYFIRIETGSGNLSRKFVIE